MSVAGIDFSSRAVDVVLLDEDTDAAEWFRFPLEGAGAFDRARDVHRAMYGTSVLWDEVLACGIEDPRGYGAGSLYRVQGAILACLPAYLLVHPLIPSQWRKACGLPGNAPKGVVAAFVDERDTGNMTPDIYWPQDACDAYCIALATRSLIQVKAA